ncbi:MAG: hypothetical protein IPN29_16280 [Saprospiraceae bacterium]|nr:hypothetical protein [Saprospiraceae bacterium]
MRKNILLVLLLTLVQFDLSATDYNGYFNFTWQEKTGKLYLKLKEFNKDFILVNYFATGLGSNDIGFDRGKIGTQKLVQFEDMAKR